MDKNITLLQIESFLATAKFQSCSRAAHSMNVTQPSLSKTIKTFESAIGRKLFERHSRGLTLTETGEYLYQTLSKLQGDFEKAIEHARNIESDVIKNLKIVLPIFFDADTNYEPIKKVLQSYKTKYPDVSIDVMLCDLKEQRQTIELGTADLVITLDYVFYENKSVMTKRISKAKRYLAISKDHPLASVDMFDFSVLEKECFLQIMNTRNNYMREILTNECLQYGFLPRKVECVPNLMTFVYYIKEQKGIGICGFLRNYESEYGIKYLSLPEPKKCQYVVAAWSNDLLSKEAQRFLDMIPT